MPTSPAPDLIRIVDDDPTVCASLTFVLQIAGFDVVSYNSADSFLEQASDLRAGCILLDVKMPGKSGLELFEEIRRRGMLLPVIFLSGHGDIEMAVETLHKGAFDFLVKPADPEALIEKVKSAVARNHSQRASDKERREIDALMQRLTPAEMQVARLLAKGLDVKTSADVLGVSQQAIKAHRSSIYRKLDAVNPVEVSVLVNEWLREASK